MNVDQIKKIYKDRGIIVTKSQIEKCITITADACKKEENEIEEIIIEYLINNVDSTLLSHISPSKNNNFVFEDYDITIDDQSSNKVAYSDQEYLNRNFSKIVNTRYPIFDKYSINISDTKYKNMPFWQIQKYIVSQLPKLENTHWTNQTLSYARTSIVGKHIVGCLVYPLVKQGLFNLGHINLENLNTIPHVKIVDATGNIGMDSITFALEKFVQSVTTYEILPNVYDMLINNIDLYGLKNRITAINKRFDYSKKIVKDALVIIDPPYEVDNNGTNFNLSIDNMPIYFVVQKILNNGARAVLLSMPKTYKYNLKFADDNNQHITVYQMGKKNNKMFLIMTTKDAVRITLPPSGTQININTNENIKTWNGKIDQYACTSNIVGSPINKFINERFVTEKVNIKIDTHTKRNILVKIFSKDVVYNNREINNISNIDIYKTLKKHVGTTDTDSWGFNKNVNSFSRKNAALLKFMPENIDTFVDLGVGSGSDTIAMATKYFIRKVITVDIKDTRENKLIPLYLVSINPRVVYSTPLEVEADFVKAEPGKPLNIELESVDVMLIFHTLHHIRDNFLHSGSTIGMLEYLKDISKLIKKGGLVFIKDHNVTNKVEASNVDFEHLSYACSSWKEPLNKLINNYGTIEPMIYYSSDEIIRWMKEAGFELLWTGIMSKLTYIYGAVFKKL